MRFQLVFSRASSASEFGRIQESDNGESDEEGLCGLVPMVSITGDALRFKVGRGRLGPGICRKVDVQFYASLVVAH